MNGKVRYRILSILLLVLSQTVSGETETEQEDKGHFRASWDKIVQVFKNVMEKDEAKNRDPWESFNRRVSAFNDVADRWVLTPVAKSYQFVTPDPLEKGIGNVFSNLSDLGVIANGLLQFEFSQAASDTGRFLVNSTLGIGGLFEVAAPMGLEKHDSDFGQTLGKWGVSPGPYVVVPFMGPYTVRSGFGAVGDAATDVVGAISHVRTRNQVLAGRLIDQRAAIFAAEALITGDRYTFIRDVYLQRRDFLANGELEEDDFGDEEFDDWEEE